VYPLGLSVCRLGGAHEGFVSTNTWCRQSLCAHEDCVGRIQTLYAAFVGPIEPLHITFCGTGPTKPLRTVFVRPAQPLYKVSVRIPKSLWCTWALLSMQTIFASPLVLAKSRVVRRGRGQPTENLILLWGIYKVYRFILLWGGLVLHSLFRDSCSVPNPDPL